LHIQRAQTMNQHAYLNRPTDRQIMYRAYLTTPAWKEKRKQALELYGCICSRCKQFGNDVHHKTYERVGGDELMEDLEVLCRECHEAHHALDAVARTPKSRRRTIHRRAIFDKLTAKHVMALWNRYPRIKNNKDLFIAINKTGRNKVAEDAAYMLGCELIGNSECFGFQQLMSSHKRKLNSR